MSIVRHVTVPAGGAAVELLPTAGFSGAGVWRWQVKTGTKAVTLLASQNQSAAEGYSVAANTEVVLMTKQEQLWVSGVEESTVQVLGTHAAE